MAWLHDNGDENELSPLEDDEEDENEKEKEGLIEEIDEEVIVTERAPSAPPASQKSKSKALKSKTPAARGKAGTKKKAAAKKAPPRPPSVVNRLPNAGRRARAAKVAEYPKNVARSAPRAARFARLPRAPGAFTNDRVLGVQAGFCGCSGCRFSRNGCVHLILVPAIFSAPDFLRAKFDAGRISRGTCGRNSAVSVRLAVVFN